MSNVINTIFRAVVALFVVVLISGCTSELEEEGTPQVYYPSNILDYTGIPGSPEDRSFLSFSDLGAWFSYSFPDSPITLGFSGPFLMTQQNGAWASKNLARLNIGVDGMDQLLQSGNFEIEQTAYPSHLQQIWKNDELEVKETLYFVSGHSAVIHSEIRNVGAKQLEMKFRYSGNLMASGLRISKKENHLKVLSGKSEAVGWLTFDDSKVSEVYFTDSTYSVDIKKQSIAPGDVSSMTMSQTFIFPEYDWEEEQKLLNAVFRDPSHFLDSKKHEKQEMLAQLYEKLDSSFLDSIHKRLLVKTLLTLQNNTRIPAGELKHAGLFPSYHFVWFHGFWAWDSWKHAVALAQFDPELAKDQVRAMYDFMDSSGFIADCIFRDTTIENHNWRNTKPPLSGWAIWEIYEQTSDQKFLEEMYPQLLRQHSWWYKFRDHDQDGVCEYGSTDGSLVAAKWESGMDNAVRFDSSEILKNSSNAFSLNQESVDLNSYLFAEKKFIKKIAEILGKKDESEIFKKDAEELKSKIQTQFFDSESGWFYDTHTTNGGFIKVMGCEGWIPLWAGVASQEQAKAVKRNMIDVKLFNTKVPFQTLTASHPKFKPEWGYWRGPNWLDQSYFGIAGLKNYGYHEEALKATHKIFQNGEGILNQGEPIRENYNPITGEGQSCKNFSWSAAHLLLLLLNE